MTYEELKRDYDNVLDSNEMLKVELKAVKDILQATESKLSLATGEIEGYLECLELTDTENEMLKADLKATKDILQATESKLSLAAGEIEGYRECLRILRGHDDDKA